MDKVFPGENLTSVVITPLQAYYLFGNGSLFYCGEYFVPNFMDASVTPRPFTPLVSGDVVTTLKYQNYILIISATYNIFKVNFTDFSFNQLVNKKVVYRDMVAGTNGVIMFSNAAGPQVEQSVSNKMVVMAYGINNDTAFGTGLPAWYNASTSNFSFITDVAFSEARCQNETCLFQVEEYVYISGSNLYATCAADINDNTDCGGSIKEVVFDGTVRALIGIVSVNGNDAYILDNGSIWYYYEGMYNDVGPAPCSDFMDFGVASDVFMYACYSNIYYVGMCTSGLCQGNFG